MAMTPYHLKIPPFIPMTKQFLPLLLIPALAACGGGSTPEAEGYSGATQATALHYPQEKHLANVKQLTFGGDNAEAYFSFDGQSLTFQSNFDQWGLQCDQIFAFNWSTEDLSKARPKLISTGLGRTTCSYYLPGDSLVLFSSTHEGDSACPAEPEKTDGKYVWPIYPSYDIYVHHLKTGKITKLIGGDGYDAEPTVSPKGDKIVFTSLRSGDLELYTCNIDGTDIKQITTGLGYDGGAFFSPDGSKIIFRASRPQGDSAQAEYKALLAQGLVKPNDMELFVCNADGSDLKQITQLGQANWAPFFHPSGQKVIFSSNHASKKGYPFNLYMINLDGTGLEQITWDGVFDAFPMFSPDGKKLVFSSNRVNGGTRATNLFIADWVD
jgi:Tol biopolymer transport system component